MWPDSSIPTMQASLPYDRYFSQFAQSTLSLLTPCDWPSLKEYGGNPSKLRPQ